MNCYVFRDFLPVITSSSAIMASYFARAAGSAASFSLSMNAIACFFSLAVSGFQIWQGPFLSYENDAQNIKADFPFQRERICRMQLSQKNSRVYASSASIRYIEFHLTVLLN